MKDINSGYVEVYLGDNPNTPIASASNYVHSRMHENLMQYFSDYMLPRLGSLSFNGDTSVFSIPYTSMEGLTEAPYFANSMGALVLAKGTPQENNPVDDTILEADSIQSVSFLDDNIAFDGYNSFNRGMETADSKRYPNGDIDIVLKYGTLGYIEFDTIYLTPHMHVNHATAEYSPLSNIEYRSKNFYLDTSSIEPHFSGTVSLIPSANPYIIGSVNGNSMFFLSPTEFLMVMGVADNVLHIAKYRKQTSNSLISYSNAELIDHIQVPMSNMASSLSPTNGYSLASITTDDKLILIADTASEKYSSPLSQLGYYEYTRRPVYMYTCDMRGNVESKVRLERTHDMPGLYGDSIKVGDYIYVLSTRTDVYNMYYGRTDYPTNAGGRLDTTNLITYGQSLGAPVLCKYSMSGKLVGVSSLPGYGGGANDGDGYLSDESAICFYHLYYDQHSKKIVVYNTDYYNIGMFRTNKVYKVDPNTMETSASWVLANGFKLNYDPYSNRLYEIGVAKDKNPYPKIAIMLRHIAPIMTKCKLPSKVIKKSGQTMTLTYKLRAGSPVD